MNPRPSAPEADALSAELRAHVTLQEGAACILNYNSVPKPKQGMQIPHLTIGFRGATLVDGRGKIVAYADKVAIGSYTVGFTSVTFASAALSRFLAGRMPQITVLVKGRPRIRLTGLRLSLPSGEQRLPDGGWACDAAVGSFIRLTSVAGHQAEPRKR